MGFTDEEFKIRKEFGAFYNSGISFSSQMANLSLALRTDQSASLTLKTLEDSGGIGEVKHRMQRSQPQP